MICTAIAIGMLLVGVAALLEVNDLRGCATGQCRECGVATPGRECGDCWGARQW